MLTAIAVVLIMGGGATIVVAIYARQNLVIVPDATDIRIQSYGIWEQHISYRTNGLPYAWYFTVIRRLPAER